MGHLRPGEAISAWAQRLGIRWVATYRAPRSCLAADDPRVAKWPPWAVEAIRSKSFLKVRAS